MHSSANEATRRVSRVEPSSGTPAARSGVSALGNLTSFEGEPPGRLTPTEDPGAGARGLESLASILPRALAPLAPSWSEKGEAGPGGSEGERVARGSDAPRSRTGHPRAQRVGPAGVGVSSPPEGTP
jgi:hypothetical protein